MEKKELEQILKTGKMVIPLSDPDVRRGYENTYTDVHFGMVLEQIDILAGICAAGHCRSKKYPEPVVVTAALDRLDLLAPIDVHKDLVMKAAINSVGRSSMEVGIRLESDTTHVASAYLTFVHVDKGKPVAVPKYVPRTADEKRRHADAQERLAHWKQIRSQGKRVVATKDEKQLLKELSKKSGRFAPMTWSYSPREMHPQDQNRYGFVFGGYIMREAYELAFNTVREYSGKRPVLVSIDRINFDQTVLLGSLMRLNRTIRYVGRSSVNVEIELEEIGSRRDNPVTNRCYFTFVGVDDNFDLIKMPQVRPSTKEEEKKYIMGYRRYQLNKKLRQKS